MTSVCPGAAPWMSMPKIAGPDGLTAKRGSGCPFLDRIRTSRPVIGPRRLGASVISKRGGAVRAAVLSRINAASAASLVTCRRRFTVAPCGPLVLRLVAQFGGPSTYLATYPSSVEPAMDDRIRRDLRFLKAYAVISTLAFGTLLIAAFRQQEQKQRFGEIDVERINIVEPDGKLRMVISNRPRSIGPIYKGKPFGYAGGTRPGIIFFNDEGTENGGLTMTGRKNPDGTYASSLHMSFDQFNQDQVVVL